MGLDQSQPPPGMLTCVPSDICVVVNFLLKRNARDLVRFPEGIHSPSFSAHASVDDMKILQSGKPLIGAAADHKLNLLTRQEGCEQRCISFAPYRRIAIVDSYLSRRANGAALRCPKSISVRRKKANAICVMAADIHEITWASSLGRGRSLTI